jgi:hypothetical protein
MFAQQLGKIHSEVHESIIGMELKTFRLSRFELQAHHRFDNNGSVGNIVGVSMALQFCFIVLNLHPIES